MNISETGINLIANFEGLYCNAYRCPANVITIGIGETGKFALTGETIHMGMKITEKQAKDSFRLAIKSYEASVNRLGIELNQNQFDALVSICYNCGSGIFKGNLLNALKDKNWTSVADQLLLYNKARVNGVLQPLAGLTRRRKAERELFLKPVEQKEDKELAEAVSKIIRKGRKIDFNSWKRMDLMELKNVQALIDRLGGISELKQKGIISNIDLWVSGKYTANHVRSLLIKFAAKC
ncbi:MAG: lysozyme [Romboutsia timonensis]